MGQVSKAIVPSQSILSSEALSLRSRLYRGSDLGGQQSSQPEFTVRSFIYFRSSCRKTYIHSSSQ